jgi:hypothetical protein
VSGRQRFAFHLLGCAGLALVVYLSLTPSRHHLIAHLAAGGDKVEHVAAFAVPVLYFGQLHRSARARVAMTVVGLLAAAGLELGQQRLGRFPALEYGDIVASSAGVLLGLALLVWTPLGRVLAGLVAPPPRSQG